MELSLRYYGDPVLHQKSQRIEDFGPHWDDLVSQMVEVMHAYEGIGLAAQQVGLTDRICVIEVASHPDRPEPEYRLDGKQPPLDLWMPCALLNPEILEFSQARETYEEGCLSFPDLRGHVIRPEAITVRFQDTRGNLHTLVCAGLLARVIQHEVDHLDGTLFIDRMEKRLLSERASRIKQIKRRTRESLRSSAHPSQ